MASKRFGVSLKQLRELMEFRGAEGVQKLNEIGGIRGLLNSLNTSEEIGKTVGNIRALKSGKKCNFVKPPLLCLPPKTNIFVLIFCRTAAE